MADLQKQDVFAWLGPQVSAGGKLFFLYSPHPKAEFPVARIFENEWENLPEWMVDLVEEAEVDEVSSGAPKKPQAASKGLLNYFENEFSIYVYKDGSAITKRVAWDETQQLWSGQQASASSQQAGASASQLVYTGFSEENQELYKTINEETFYKVETALAKIETIFEDWPATAKADLLNSALYANDRIFASVRGATLISPDAINPIEEAKARIIEGDAEDFMLDVATGHSLILDDEHARTVFKKLDVTGFTAEQKDSGEARAALAMKAWLYVDLVSKYGQTPTIAKKLTEQTYDELPF